MRDAFERFMKAVDMEQFNQMKTSSWGKDTSYINILHLIIIGHNKEITVSELAEKLGLSRPAVTQKVNELENLGLIKKIQSKTDKRYFYISLAEKVTKDVANMKSATVLQVVEEQFSKEKKAVFEEILNFMADYVEGSER